MLNSNLIIERSRKGIKNMRGLNKRKADEEFVEKSLKETI
jgi:hypothetical protein